MNRDARDELFSRWRAEAPGPRKQRLLGQLVSEYAGLIKQLGKKFAFIERSALEHDDLIQAASIGFITALEKFDPSRGFTIATYAGNWVRHEIQCATRGGRPVKLPRIRLTNEERRIALERMRADPEVTAESLGISEAKFQQLRCSMGLRFISTATNAGALVAERHDARSSGEDDVSMEDRIDAAREVRAAGGIDALEMRPLFAFLAEGPKNYIAIKAATGFDFESLRRLVKSRHLVEIRPRDDASGAWLASKWRFGLALNPGMQNGTANCQANGAMHVPACSDTTPPAAANHVAARLVAPGGIESAGLTEPTRLLELLAGAPKTRAELLKNPTISDRQIRRAIKSGLVVRIGSGKRTRFAHGLSAEASLARQAAPPKKRKRPPVASPSVAPGSFSMSLRSRIEGKRAAALKVVEACDAMLAAMREDVA